MLGFSKLVVAVTACIAWMTVSSGLILLNKNILANGFPFPMALAGMGMGCSSLGAFLCCRVFEFVSADKAVSWQLFVTKILPVGFFMAGTLSTGNLVYLYLTVSLIQMLKAFSPVLVMLGLFIAGLDTPSRKLVVSVCCITIGTILSSYGEVNFSWLGFFIMLSSECFESTRLVLTEVLLVGMKFHPIEGLMYLAPACFFWLLLGSMFFEFPKMREVDALGLVLAHPIKFGAAAVMGFAVNSLAYIVIHTASSLTLKVLGPVKNTAVVFCGIVFLHETVTWIQGMGYSMSMAAFFVYNHLKMQQLRGAKDGSGKGDEPGGADRPLASAGSGKYAAVPTEEDRLEEGVVQLAESGATPRERVVDHRN